MTSPLPRPEDAPPLFTVILPCRGREALLRRALRSVAAQTVSDWEAVVVDDASATPLAPVVEAFGDPRMRCLRLDRNLGPGGAREAGLTVARGRFVAFLDSDDLWRPRTLATHERRLKRGDMRVSVVGAEVQEGRGRRRRPDRPGRPGERVGAFLFVANQYAQISGVAAPTSLARRAGFGGLRQYEDWHFLLRAQALGAEVVLDDAPLVVRAGRGRTDSLGAEDDRDRAIAFLHAAGSALRPIERDGFALRCLGPALAERTPWRAARLAATIGPRRPRLLGAAGKLLLRSALGRRGYGRLQGLSTRLRPGPAGAPLPEPGG
jgi:glycosyltransferase involved in cell wall biosynthesis